MKHPRLGSLVAVGSLAACLVTHAAAADGVRPDFAAPAQREQAQSRFLRAKDLMGRKKYDEALAEFRASREIVASPNTRLEIARCLRAQGKLAGAYAELGRTVTEAKELMLQDTRYQPAYDAAKAERAELEPQLGFVSLALENASERTRVIVGGEELRRADWSEPVAAEAGSTEVRVETPDHEPIRRTVTISAGQRASLTIDARSGDDTGKTGSADAAFATPRSPQAGGSRPSPSWMRNGAYVAGGLGVAGVATFAIFGLVARSTYDDLNGACPGGQCPPDKASEISSGKTNQIVANVGLAFGLVGLATSVTYFLLSKPPDTSVPANLAARAQLVIAPTWAGLRGDF